jgi:glucose/mannose-6-phosphate isomerase
MELIKLASGARENFFSGFEQGKNISLPLKRSIIAAGMGGSILAAEIFADFLKLEGVTGLNFTVWQDYFLPEIKNRNNVQIFCFSYSGNTQETISVFKLARKNRLPTFSFGRGGELEKLAGSNYFLVPDFSAPRFAVPYLLGLIFSILLKEDFSKVRKKLAKNSLLRLRRKAYRLANSLKDEFVLIYSPHSLRSLAHFWEINLDETAKIPAFLGEVPDIDHHDLAGFSNLKNKNNFAALFLRDPDNLRILNKRIDLTAKFFEKHLGIKSFVLELDGNNYLEKIINQLILAYFVSLRLAGLKQVDPLENLIQEKLKKALE